MTDDELLEIRRAMQRDFAPRRPQQLPRGAYRNFRHVKDERHFMDLEATMRLQATRHGLRA